MTELSDHSRSSSSFSQSAYSAPPLSCKAKKQLKLEQKFFHQFQQKNQSAQSSIDEQYENGSKAESIGQYDKNGYHPAYLGELFCNGKFQIVQKLGWGTFSTVYFYKQVWLAQNIKDKKFYALKIQKSKSIQTQMALDEISILKQSLILTFYNIQRVLKCETNLAKWKEMNIQEDTHTIELIEFFPHFRINGSHCCSVYEVMGPTLLDLINFNQQKVRKLQGVFCIFSTPLLLQSSKLSIPIVKLITKQILFGLMYIHEICKVIHTDIKPENVMLCLSNLAKKQYIEYLKSKSVKPTSMKYLEKKKNQKLAFQKIYYSDEEEAEDSSKQEEPKESDFVWKDNNDIRIQLDSNLQVKIVDFGNACWENKHFTKLIQTKEYRSPEVLLGAGYFPNSDIWSVGCLVFELLTNNYLFDPSTNLNYSEEEDHLSMIMETLGKISPELLQDGTETNKYFNANGNLMKIKVVKNEHLGYNPIHQILISEYGFDDKEAFEIEEFLVVLLTINPKIRINARQALQLKWLQN